MVVTETIVNIKFGFEELSDANIYYIAQWVAIMFCGAFFGLGLNYLAGYIFFRESGYPVSEEEGHKKKN